MMKIVNSLLFVTVLLASSFLTDSFARERRSERNRHNHRHDRRRRKRFSPFNEHLTYRRSYDRRQNVIFENSYSFFESFLFGSGGEIKINYTGGEIGEIDRKWRRLTLRDSFYHDHDRDHRWDRTSHSKNERFIVYLGRDYYPFLAYGGYIYRYDQTDHCDYRLIDGKYGEPLRTFSDHCSLALDRCFAQLATETDHHRYFCVAE